MARIRHQSRGRVVLCVLVVAQALLGHPQASANDPVGSVSGVVTAGGAPLATAWVVLTPVTANGDWAGWPLQVATDENGRYAVDDLAAAHVKVHVRSPLTGDYVTTYWPGVYAFGQAGTVTVTPGGSMADIDLPAGRSIEGRVVAEGTGEPVEGVRIVARIADALWAEPVGRFAAGAGEGEFDIGGLPPVPVRLHVQVPQGSPFLGDGHSSDRGPTANRRVDKPGDVTGLVIRLPRGGEVTGTVRDEGGQPLGGAWVRVENCHSGCPRETATDESGAYRIRGIPPSDRLIVHARAPGTIDQWFAGATSWTAATELGLGAGEVRVGVDFVLVAGAVLVGRVIAGDEDQPASDVAFYLESVVTPGRRYFADFSESDAGTYRIGPVPPDTYHLVLLPTARQAQSQPARWFDATGIDSFGVISLDPGEEAEVVVRLDRAPAASSPAHPPGPPVGSTGGQSDTGTSGAATPPAQCSVAAGGWQGLFRGFLGEASWPLTPSCPAAGAASMPPVVRSE